MASTSQLQCFWAALASFAARKCQSFTNSVPCCLLTHFLYCPHLLKTVSCSKLQLKLAPSAKKEDKSVRRCSDSRSAKVRRQGKDDSIKQFGIDPYPTDLPTLEICREELYIELFYAIIYTLFYCYLLISYPYISLCFLVWLYYYTALKTFWILSWNYLANCILVHCL